MGRDWASYSKRVPDLSIQDGKKRLGGLRIVFMEMRAVTGFSGRIRPVLERSPIRLILRR